LRTNGLTKKTEVIGAFRDNAKAYKIPCPGRMKRKSATGKEYVKVETNMDFFHL
jgi:hypothetical protein